MLPFDVAGCWSCGVSPEGSADDSGLTDSTEGHDPPALHHVTETCTSTCQPQRRIDQNPVLGIRVSHIRRIDQNPVLGIHVPPIRRIDQSPVLGIHVKTPATN